MKKSYYITLVYRTKEEENLSEDGYSMKSKGDGSVYDDYFIRIINNGKSVAHEVKLRDNIARRYLEAIRIKNIETALKNEILKEDIQAINPDEVVTVYWSFAIEFIVNKWYKERLLNEKKRMIDIDPGFELSLQYFDSNNRKFKRSYQFAGHLYKNSLNEREVTCSLRLNEVMNQV